MGVEVRLSVPLVLGEFELALEEAGNEFEVGVI